MSTAQSSRDTHPPAAQRFAPLGSFGAPRARRPWAASFAASSTIYVAAVVVLLTFSATTQIAKTVPVALTFVEKIVKAPPIPEPPPPEVKPAAPPKPAAAAAMAPVVRPDQKVRRLEAPPPPKELVAPKELPREAAPEADPSQDKGVAVYGEPGSGDPAGLEGGVAKGGRLGGIAGGVIDLPAGAQPPAMIAGEPPAYPRQARAAEMEGTVVLRIIVLADGSVSKVEVISGDEPFVSAALRAVKGWRYRPAKQDGQAIAVYHTVRIPFTLEDEG